MIVEWPDASSLKQDMWVQVMGPVDAVSFDKGISPLIRAEAVDLVPQPDQPYLYP
jgi:putative membrane protein